MGQQLWKSLEVPQNVTHGIVMTAHDSTPGSAQQNRNWDSDHVAQCSQQPKGGHNTVSIRIQMDNRTWYRHYFHTMEYYSTIKRKKIQTLYNMDRPENIVM